MGLSWLDSSDSIKSKWFKDLGEHWRCDVHTPPNPPEIRGHLPGAEAVSKSGYQQVLFAMREPGAVVRQQPLRIFQEGPGMNPFFHHVLHCSYSSLPGQDRCPRHPFHQHAEISAATELPLASL